jgi:protein-S-isoprenylcysteine O-methyltransferase Ste14
MQPPKLLPPHYLLISVVLMALIRVFLHLPIFEADWVFIGLFPILLGLAMAGYAARQFSKAETNIIPLTESTALVKDGMYRYTRNPMYVGMFLFLGGLALLLNSALAWLITISFFFLVRTLFVLREEPLMRETFGQEYDDFCAAVRRWI